MHAEKMFKQEPYARSKNKGLTVQKRLEEKQNKKLNT